MYFKFLKGEFSGKDKKAETNPPPTNLLSDTTNTHIESIPMNEKKTKPCEFCEEEPAIVLCPECYKCYCDECNMLVHKKGSKKGHHTENIPEGITIETMCPLHVDIPLKMFCLDEIKLCCGTCKVKDLHKGHKVVDLEEIPKDNEIFSASKVNKDFVDALGWSDTLTKKIEAAIENIKREGDEARKKIKQTFEEEHQKLTLEEYSLMKELEGACNECEETLQNNLICMREMCEYNGVLNQVYTKIRKEEGSRLMELNIAVEMEKQRKGVKELQKLRLTDLKVEWNKEGRKLSFTRHFINNNGTIENVVARAISHREIEISWDFKDDTMSEEGKTEVIFNVELRKKSDNEKSWKKVYTGKAKSAL